MARRGFSKEAFEKSNERISGNRTGDFPEITKGVYVATIQRAEIKDRDSGSRGVSLGFQISDEDESYPGQYVWWNQTLQNKDGAENEIGIDQFNQMLYRLSEGHFSFDDFKFDKEGFCVNENDVMENFLDTEVKIFVQKSGEYQGSPQYKVKVQKVLRNTYVNGMTDSSSVRPQDELDVEEPDLTPTPRQKEEQEQKAKAQAGELPTEENGETEPVVGMAVLYVKGEKIKKRGRIATFIEGPNDTGIIQITETDPEDDTFTKFTGETIVAKPNNVLPFTDIPIISMKEEPKGVIDSNDLTEEELDLEEEKEEKHTFKVGMKVSYPHEGKMSSGTIHSIDEDLGIVVVAFTAADGKKKGRKVSLSDLVPF